LHLVSIRGHVDGSARINDDDFGLRDNDSWLEDNLRRLGASRYWNLRCRHNDGWTSVHVGETHPTYNDDQKYSGNRKLRNVNL
jgi:hypothetical protein